MYHIYRLISVIFHPLLLPIAATISFFILNDAYIDRASQLKIILIIATGTYFLPILLLLILKKRKLIENLEVRKIKERKIPLIFMTILFYILAKTTAKIPSLTILSQLFLGCSISLSICYLLIIANLKISLHMIGISTYIAFITMYSIYTQTNLLVLLACLFLIAGITAKARLALKEHSLKEVLLGFSIGYSMQLFVVSIGII